MLTITQVSKAMQELLLEKANDLAIETGFTERERIVTGSSFVLGLMSGWQADPQASLAGLSQAIGNAGTPISRQGLDYRFDRKAVQFLRAVLEASLKLRVQAMPLTEGLLSRFSSVDVVDSSVISLPNELASAWQGCGGFGENASVAALKLHLRWDLRSGGLKGLDLSAGTVHDRQSQVYQQGHERGSLQLTDLGYFKLDDFEGIDQEGAYWLSRYKLKTKLFELDGKAIDLKTWLPQKRGERLDCEVLLGQSKRLACRLVAERVPLWVVQQRHERLKETARQNQSEVSQEALEMAHWTIYLTNLPAELLATAEVFVLGRYRWQIELLFKLWKSDLAVDKWASCKPERILVEIYTKLLGAIVTHWLLLLACWQNPRRSLRQAIPSVRAFAWQFANSLICTDLIHHALASFCRALSVSSMGKSHKDPRAFQLIYEDIS